MEEAGGWLSPRSRSNFLLPNFLLRLPYFLLPYFLLSNSLLPASYFLLQPGAVWLFPGWLMGRDELAAVALPQSEQPCFDKGNLTGRAQFCLQTM